MTRNGQGGAHYGKQGQPFDGEHVRRASSRKKNCTWRAPLACVEGAPKPPGLVQLQCPLWTVPLQGPSFAAWDDRGPCWRESSPSTRQCPCLDIYPQESPQETEKMVVAPRKPALHGPPQKAMPRQPKRAHAQEKARRHHHPAFACHRHVGQPWQGALCHHRPAAAQPEICSSIQ